MDLSLSSDQEAFVAASRRMLEKVCPPEVVCRAMTPEGTGHSTEVWQVLADAGWMGMIFPEEFGGAGANLFELGLAFREAGRALLPTTFSSTMMAGQLLTRLGTAAQKERWLVPLCSGGLVATAAMSESHAHEDFDHISTTARPTDAGWTLEGGKALVANAGIADITLVLAKVAHGGIGSAAALFIVPRDSRGVEVELHATFGRDALYDMQLARCELPELALLGGPDAIAPWRDLCSDTITATRALRCMEMVGGTEAVVERTVAYLTQRHQFGVPIGSFQAVQHHLANVGMRLEAGRIAAFRALWVLSERGAAARELTIAELWMRDTYVQATLTAHQVWGGMGYALEGGQFMWSERAKTLDLVSGRRPGRLEELLACTSGLAAG